MACLLFADHVNSLFCISNGILVTSRFFCAGVAYCCRFVPYFGEEDKVGVDLSAYSKVNRGHVCHEIDNEAAELVSYVGLCVFWHVFIHAIFIALPVVYTENTVCFLYLLTCVCEFEKARVAACTTPRLARTPMCQLAAAQVCFVYDCGS